MKEKGLLTYAQRLARNQDNIFLIRNCFISIIFLVKENVETFQHLQSNYFSQNCEYFICFYMSIKKKSLLFLRVSKCFRVCKSKTFLKIRFILNNASEDSVRKMKM